MADPERLPAPAEGILLTHFIVSADVPRSCRFYTDVLGFESPSGWTVSNVHWKGVRFQTLWDMVEPHLDEMRSMGTFGDGASGNLPEAASNQTRLLDAFGRRP